MCCRYVGFLSIIIIPKYSLLHDMVFLLILLLHVYCARYSTSVAPCHLQIGGFCSVPVLICPSYTKRDEHWPLLHRFFSTLTVSSLCWILCFRGILKVRRFHFIEHTSMPCSIECFFRIHTGIPLLQLLTYWISPVLLLLALTLAAFCCSCCNCAKSKC